MLDIKDNPDEIIFLNTQEEEGSWSVLNSGDKILSKQTKVSEDVYDMQCWAHQVIFVDAGVESGDFYNFYTDKACSNKISKDADGSYHLNKNTKYTFGRCAGATSHPFEVYPTGTTPAAVGISGDETKSVQSGDLTWVCTSHPGMTGTFKAVGDTDWSEKVRFDTSSSSDMLKLLMITSYSLDHRLPCALTIPVKTEAHAPRMGTRLLMLSWVHWEHM